MTERVDSSKIEQIVGVNRHLVGHFARAVSAEQMVYILHSQECVDEGEDLRRCRYSMALDRGIEMGSWEHCLDRPVPIAISNDGRIVPNTLTFRGRI